MMAVVVGVVIIVIVVVIGEEILYMGFPRTHVWFKIIILLLFLFLTETPFLGPLKEISLPPWIHLGK